MGKRKDTCVCPERRRLGKIAVDRGAWQGAPHSNVAFYCAPTTATSNSKPAWEHGIAGGRYADDCVYHGPAGTVADNSDDLKEKLQEAGLELHDKKSAAYTPSIEDLNEDERKGLHRMLEIVPRADHPPRVLGTMAQNPKEQKRRRNCAKQSRG